MKLKSNQTGIAHVLAVTAVVLIAVIGFAGWKVWEAQVDKKVATSKGNKLVSTSCTEGYTLETNVDMNIRFCLPVGWKSEFQSQSDISTRLLYITSPDQKDAYYGGTDTGSKVTIVTHLVDEYHPSSKDILTAKSQFAKNLSATMIAGRDGVTFLKDSEGDSEILYNQFENDGMIYLVQLEKDVSGSNFNDNLDKYQKIVDTLSLVN
jgi:hypothetical protein